MLIDYIIKNVKIDKTDEFDIITIIIQLLTRISEFYDEHLSEVPATIFLINHHMVSWNEEYKSEIVYIVKYKNDQLLLDSYEKIKLLANNVGCKELTDILRDYPYSL